MWQVVLAAEVGQHQVLQVLPAQLGHQARGLVVVQMSLVAADPQLEKARVMPTGQQVAAMVGFDQQGIEPLIALQQLRVVAAQVGEHAEAAATVADHVLQRLVGIMLDPCRADLQIADLHDIAATEKTGHLHRLAHAAQGTLAEVDRYIVAP